MAARPWHLLSLCDGYGGTELALRSVARVRTVCRVERDAYAAAVLVERMGQARLDQCPVWDDVATFDGAAWRGRVDVVAAGFPCPDFSSAGRRAGVDGEHWLWPECFEVIREVGPSIVLLENVPGLVRLGGLTRVLSDLADVGFDAEWGLLSASAVGAPHERERWWLVAHAQRSRWGADVGDDGAGQPDDAGVGACMADAESDGCEGRRIPDRPERATVGVTDGNGPRTGQGDVGHTSSSGRRQDTRGTPGDEASDGWRAGSGHIAGRAIEDVEHATRVDEREPHDEACAVPRRHSRQDAGGRRIHLADTQDHRCEVGESCRCESQRTWPPGRDDHDGWKNWIAQGGPQPVLRRLTHGPPLGLADALHLGGNGLVPQCAAHAWRQLLDRGGWLT